jgi:carboxylesterase
LAFRNTSAIVIFFGLFFAHSAFSQIKCLRDLESNLAEQTALWDERYLALDENFSGIEIHNQPTLTLGQGKKLAILLHGFMGSPDEMSAIGAQLNAQNYHVYNLLIPGFGGTGFIANQFSHQTWTRWLAGEIAKAKACSQEILLVGFSTGGLLIHDWLTKNPNDPAISAAVLISPYFETSGFFRTVIQQTASKLMTEISVNIVNAIPWFYDVQVMTEKRESYMQMVPLTNSNQIVELGSFNQTRRSAKVQTPTLVFLSEDDQITDPQIANALTAKSLAHRQLVAYGANVRARVPHHIMSAEVSPVVEDLEARLVDFALNQR